MSPRITQSDLENLVTILNERRTTPGKFELSYAYGGVSLHKRIDDTSTAVNDVFRCGHVPKRELYNRIQSALVSL